MCAANDSSKNVKSKQKEDSPRQSHKMAETLLVIEDEPSVRKLVVACLREMGYKVLESAEAKDALFLAQRYEGLIDMLITDVVMPGMNGVELSRRIRRLRPEISVLFLTGYGDEDLARRGIEECEDLMVKPLSTADLGRHVRRLLDAAKHRAE